MGNTGPLAIDLVELDTPKNMHVLRMLIRDQNSMDVKLPSTLEWARLLVNKCDMFSRSYGLPRHPFLYLTVRSGDEIGYTPDDTWHVDGFSMKYNHLPEYSFIWTDTHPTEFLRLFPTIAEYALVGFDPMKHNLHSRLQIAAGKMPESAIYRGEPFALHLINPYVLHRRPQVPKGVQRTFIRITMSPIEIRDVNNTQNQRLPKQYTFDGVKDFRDRLI